MAPLAEGPPPAAAGPPPVGPTTALETHGYLGEGADAIYYAHHAALGNVHGTVLLCGALGLEAAHAAIVWTRLARTLAAAGWNAVRFDWRGTGESGGSFAEMTLGTWRQDLCRVHAGLAGESQPPLVFLGLRGGALVAARYFAEGAGDALVLWEPPASGRAHLLDVLRRKLAADYALGVVDGRKTREEQLAELEAGHTVEIEGFPWSPGLWRSLAAEELAATDAPRRPTLVLSSRTHRIGRPPFWQDSLVLCADVSAWVQPTLALLQKLGRSSSLAPSFGERAACRRVGRTSREIVPFFHRHLRLVGTHHVPESSSGTAVLLGNFGYVPRGGQGGLAARICDELARSGIHGFRVDLPGLGDSEGALCDDGPAWFAAVRAGSMVDATMDVIEQLRSRFGVERVLLGGLCAAATTALYAFERDSRAIAGLLLLEPELFSADAVDEQEPADDDSREPGLSWTPPRLAALAGYGRRAFTRWSWMRIVTGESKAARSLPIPRQLVRRLLWLARERMPARTNLPLVVAWQNAVRRRVPTLVVTAQGKMRELFFDRVNEFAVPGYGRMIGPAQAIEHVRVPSTNHTFTTGGAIDRVCEIVTDWVIRRYAREAQPTADAVGGVLTTAGGFAEHPRASAAATRSERALSSSGHP